MKLFLGITTAWVFVGLIGLAGLFSAQTALMGVCFVAWTPAAIVWGYTLHLSGVRVAFVRSQHTSPERKPEAAPNHQIAKRIRRIGNE
jgi:hypothetical protein